MSELGDLLELLHGARNRYSTVRLTRREWRDLRLAEVAFTRAAEESGAESQMLVLTAEASPGEEEGPEIPAFSEVTVRVWIDGHGRTRQERDGADGASLAITDGPRWWHYHPALGPISNVDDPEIGGGGGQGGHESLLDPAPLPAAHDLTIVGRARTVGREAILVQARPRTNAPDGFPGALPWGADVHELTVDAERGVLLRVASFVDGREFALTEVTEIAFDEQFPAETFAFESPDGKPARSPREDMPRSMSLAEAVALAPFTIWIVPELEPGWRLDHVAASPGRDAPRQPPEVFLHYSYRDVSRQFSLQERPAGALRIFNPHGTTERIERDGREYHVHALGPKPHPHLPISVAFVRNGTGVEIQSSSFDLEELLDLAVSLVPAPPDPPSPLPSGS